MLADSIRRPASNIVRIERSRQLRQSIARLPSCARSVHFFA
jgi:hypothetical protein